MNHWWGLFHSHDGRVAVILDRPALFKTRAQARFEQRRSHYLHLRLRRVSLTLPDAPPTRRKKEQPA